MNTLLAIALAALPASAAAPALETFQVQLPHVRFEARSPWQELSQKVVAVGAFRDADGTLPAGYGLEDIRGAKTAEHVADYVNVWGYKDAEGRFSPGFVTLVSEDWKLDAQDRWRVTQWLYTLGMDGAVSKVSWHVIVETRDGMVVDYQSQAKKPEDADAREKLSALLGQWTAFGRAPAR